jgi:hypothetical protein
MICVFSEMGKGPTYNELASGFVTVVRQRKTNHEVFEVSFFGSSIADNNTSIFVRYLSAVIEILNCLSLVGHNLFCDGDMIVPGTGKVIGSEVEPLSRLMDPFEKTDHLFVTQSLPDVLLRGCCQKIGSGTA